MRLFVFGSRGACAFPNCPQACTGFVSENPDGSPKYSDFESADVLCFICDHPWTAHLSLVKISPSNISFARGGTENGLCSSFLSPETSWNMRMVCLCRLPRGAHARLSIEGTNTTPLPAPVSTTSTSAPAPHRPVTAFAGLARPAAISVQHTRESSAATAQQTRPSSSSIAASVQADRRGSIQRTLHPERASGSTSTSSSNLSPRKRKSGPPRPYSDSAAVPLADFASSSVAVSTTVSITVCILPKVLESSDHSDALDLSPRYT
ncbi:hypothetical protein R3P38DRAFT_3496595 [Favolaschia claudopus]|uniref:Uncharacterized protein n=1 Tax=Favolaschia claudopus TaxID=2862362 RepID=A0AAW0C4R2_9AGAR